MYLIKRLLSAVVVIWGVLTLVFFALSLAPGDPVEVILGENASITERQNLRYKLNLHLPVHERYLLYIKQLSQGDLGASIHQKKAVIDIILPRLGNTVELAVSSLIVALMLAFPLGLLAAFYKNTWIDSSALFISLLGISIPNFVMGPVLVLIFSLWLKWLPTGGIEEAGALVLPCIALGTALMAVLARMLRANLLDTQRETYLIAARARGVSQHNTLLRHALPNALLPMLTIIGLQLGTLLGGAVITEVIFSWPGIGSALIESIERRDYPVVQGCILIISLAYVLVNLFIDLLYAYVDPRIQYQAA